MSPERTDKTRGSYRFDEHIPGVGRLRRKSGALTVRDHNQRVALVRKLRDGAFPRLDLLRGLHDGTLTIAELLDADSRQKLAGLQVSDVIGKRPLWEAVESTLAGMTAAPATVETYRKSWKALRSAGALPETAKVRDLATLDWVALERQWGRSGASWNQLRRAASRTLTVLLGGKEHPLRGLVLIKFPRRVEVERMPDLTPKEFQRALAKMPRPLQGPIMTLVLTGMRIGEYRRLTPANLGRFEVRISGTKTPGSVGTVAVDPSLWGWVTASVPCPVSIWVLRNEWAAALEAAKLPHLTLHDLRHCTGQWLHDAGRPLSSIMQLLRQKTVAMTHRYTKRKLRQEDAAAMASVLGIPQVRTQVRTKQVKQRA